MLLSYSKGNTGEGGIHLSKPVTPKYFKMIEITRKRLKPGSDKVISLEVINQRKAYSRERRAAQHSYLVFLDSSGFDLHLTNNYGYDPKNIDALRLVSSNKGYNVSLIGSLSYNGELSFRLIEDSYDEELLISFLSNTWNLNSIRSSVYL